MKPDDQVIAIVDAQMAALKGLNVGEVGADVAREALLMTVATQVRAFGLNTEAEIRLWCDEAGERMAEQMLGLLEIAG